MIDQAYEPEDVRYSVRGIQNDSVKTPSLRLAHLLAHLAECGVHQAFDHMNTANRLDPKWLATLDRVVTHASDAGLSVIIDEHDANACSDDPNACDLKLTAFWQQIGARYRAAPTSVLFELLNEPHGNLDADRENALLLQIPPVVRATTPHRTLVIRPANWNSLSKIGHPEAVVERP